MPAAIERKLLLNQTLLSDNVLQVFGLHIQLLEFSSQCSSSNQPFSFNKIVAAPVNLSVEELLRWRLFNWGCLNEVDPNDLFSDISLGSISLNSEVTYVQELEFSTSPYPPIHWLQQASAMFPALQFVLAFTNASGSNQLAAQKGKLCVNSTLTQTKLRLERLV